VGLTRCFGAPAAAPLQIDGGLVCWGMGDLADDGPMTKAMISPGYRWRLVLVAVLGFGFAGWFLKDGFLDYPRQRRIFEAYDQFVKNDRQADWPAYAQERGWPDGIMGPPGKNYSDKDIMLQKVLGFVLLPLGLIFLAGAARTVGRWIGLDEDGVITSWGQKVPFAAITHINKERWDSKGIAVLFYEVRGEEKRLVLDDWKYDQKATEEILAAVERDAGSSGQDQPPPEASGESETAG
jgi:hypothetical protein